MVFRTTHLITLTLLLGLFTACQVKEGSNKETEKHTSDNKASLGLDLHEQETDPLVLEKLEKYQDMKFGFFVHWGLYSQWGGVASWPLIKNFADTREDDVAFAKCNRDFDQYFKYYYNSNKTFNPVKFNPKDWAKIAESTGMKYFVFVTKHHDGFAMFDTKQTDFSITGSESPYRTNPNADIAKVLFDAFRDKGLSVGAYFSKPDWSNPYYWSPDFPVTDHSVNYDARAYPGKWEEFKSFTHNQLKEIVSNYGPLDLLWLDGAQVLPVANQDIDMEAIAKMARAKQPGMIIVDRLAGGKYENYLSPEGLHNLPEKPLHKPWELCMSLGNGWSHRNNDVFKPSEEIIHILIEVVAKGGNLLLDVGPPASGEIPADAIKQMKAIGMWLDINGESIYNTRRFNYFQENEQVRYTQSKDGQTVYALCNNWPESNLKLSKVVPQKDSKIYLLGSDKALKWSYDKQVLNIKTPEALKNELGHTSNQAFVFKIEGSAAQMVEEIAISYQNANDSGSYFTADKCGVILSCNTADAQIYYTLDGTAPNENSPIYKDPIQLNSTKTIKALACKQGLANSPIFQKQITKVKKVQEVLLVDQTANKETNKCEINLIDLQRGSLDHADEAWMAIEQNDLAAQLDLGEVKPIEKISLGFLKNVYESIFVPDSVNYYISNDGIEFTKIGSIGYKISPFEMKVYVKDYVLDGINKSARYIKIEAKNMGTCPHPHFNSGGKAWLLCDEIIVE